MKIAQVAPLFEAVPPEAYGGTERVVGALCDGLVAAGHEVTLFAAGTSKTMARLAAVVEAPLRMRMNRRQMLEVAPRVHRSMLVDVDRIARDFDIVHSHVDVAAMPDMLESMSQWVVTVHGRLDTVTAREALARQRGVMLVSISDSQRAAVADLGLSWASTVYNGLDLEEYRLEPRGDGGYLAFLGRINPEKGPALAVEIARRAGQPLRVAAKIDPLDFDYYHHEIEPLFAANDVCFSGELTEAQKPAFLAGARATLFPSDWPEPFGLVMIESMAAGTPVIALRRGSVPEIIVDGVTGFVCDDLDEMVAAVDRVHLVDPEACRHRAARFDVAAMRAGYEALYRKVCASRRGGESAFENVSRQQLEVRHERPPMSHV